MRKGDNPASNQQLLDDPALHRLIIPLYIPQEEGYFEQAFPIFELSLRSALKTSSSNLTVSVVSNGSCEAVHQKLHQLQEQGLIDELIIVREGIGKVNSVFKAVRTARERLITIADADVLFDNGWEDAVLEVFEQVPKAGAVCPVPVFRKQFNLTANIWFKQLFSSKLKFSPVKNPEAMTLFAKSIGWPRLDHKYKDVIATLDMPNGNKAVVGCSHFVATYKREVFEQAPSEPSKYKIRGDSELLYTDLPVIKQGGYRLSTYDNYAFHMGNVLEAWMTDKFNGLSKGKSKDPLPDIKLLSGSPRWSLFGEKLFEFLLSKKPFKRWLLTKKGLNKEQLANFIGDK